MCLSPISIPNPNFGKYSNSKSRVKYLKNTVTRYIRVSCGHCSECIHTKQISLCQRVIMESFNNYVFFATLTYNNDMIPRLVTSQGVELRYADWRDLQLCFKRLRETNAFTRPFRYVAVSELGSKKGRPHFHILFFVPKFSSDDLKITPINLEKVLYDSLKFEWRRNIGSRRVPVYKSLFTFQQKYKGGKIISNYDLH